MKCGLKRHIMCFGIYDITDSYQILVILQKFSSFVVFGGFFGLA